MNVTILHLHSTIFILKLIQNHARFDNVLFTFYYIYIKTALCASVQASFVDLHSTIFILKLLTFLLFLISHVYLHSTIFILKHNENKKEVNHKEFTFYYIYIKTCCYTNLTIPKYTFTFYYIYIKT